MGKREHRVLSPGFYYESFYHETSNRCRTAPKLDGKAKGDKGNWFPAGDTELLDGLLLRGHSTSGILVMQGNKLLYCSKPGEAGSLLLALETNKQYSHYFSRFLTSCLTINFQSPSGLYLSS